MFAECEKWRIEFGVEELKRTFVFEEKEEVWRYYPQYYHKTDKVPNPANSSPLFFPFIADTGVYSLVDRVTTNNWIRLISLQCIRSRRRNGSCKMSSWNMKSLRISNWYPPYLVDEC